MRKLIGIGIALLLLAVPATSPAKAQGQTRVYSSCGGASWTSNDLGRPFQLLPDGRLCISGTISASLAGFAPNGNYTTLTATAASSASTALPGGSDVAFQNLSSVDVSCVITAGASTATTNKIIVRAGATVFLTVGSATTAACINQTGSASNVVALMGGSGLGTNFGGGGGGGGGGGAVTVADGASVVDGTTTDAAVAAGAAGSHAAKFRRMTTDIDAMKTSLASIDTKASQALPAQSGIGNVNIGAVQSAGSAYETVAASQTAQALGATGATGDYLSHCVIYPTSTSPGVVTVFDNANAAATNAIAFPGGASSLSNLAPIAIPVGAISTAGAWKVTTGANVVVTCYGKFT